MITRVWGYINGSDEISFTHQDGDVWVAAVPATPDGQYVSELYAENDTGKQAFVCRILWTICGHEMQGRIIGYGLQGGTAARGYAGMEELRGFLGALVKGGLIGNGQVY